MSETKFTPGPWMISPHPWPEQIGCCPLTGRPYSVHAADNRNVAAATTKEIARLIAAAPEMYEALRFVCEQSRALRSGGPDQIDLVGLSEALNAAVEAAGRALDKAEGCDDE